MTSRELIKRIINREDVERTGFWLGQPRQETWEIYLKYFGVDTEEEVRDILGDDLVWYNGDRYYQMPETNNVPFVNPRKGEGLSSEGVFSDCESLDEIEAYSWPNAENLKFDLLIEKFKKSGDKYRLSGMWSPFYHVVSDMLGMENYFIKMYTDPEIVHAITSRVVDYYVAGSDKLFREAGDEIDGFFFGNDLGTQLDLMISPDCFAEFVFPYMSRLIEVSQRHKKQVIMHSCGSVYKIIPNLIDLGVECLHPLQALAANMEPEKLSAFKDKISFFGNIDTQQLLVHGNEEDVKEAVRRSRKSLAPHYIVSPSHEGLLPNVHPKLLVAMSEEAHKKY